MNMTQYTYTACTSRDREQVAWRTEYVQVKYDIIVRQTGFHNEQTTGQLVSLTCRSGALCQNVRNIIRGYKCIWQN